MLALVLRVNDFLTGLLVGAGLRLIEYKSEFGRLIEDAGEMRIVIADEISPDTCRIWNINDNDPLDSDRFDLELGRESEAYQEIARRLGIFSVGAPTDV